jgi:hypothetical protein
MLSWWVQVTNFSTAVLPLPKKAGLPPKECR